MMLRKIKFNLTLVLGCVLTLSMLFSSCSNDDNSSSEPQVEPEDVNKSTGFIGVGTTSSGNQVVKYFEEIPTGTVDLSDGDDYIRFVPSSIYGGAIYTDRTDGESGLAKHVVNSEGEITEEAIIIGIDGTSRIAVRDSIVGVFQDLSTPNTITVFNPTTFEVTGSIDMSAGFTPDANYRHDKFIFRGDDLFAPIRGLEGDFYTSFIVHQANLSTNTFVGDTQRDGNGTNLLRSFLTLIGNSYVDISGDLYIPDAGNYEGVGLNGRLNKISAGSNEIDPTYIFEPGVTLSPTNFLPTFNGFIFLEDGKAIARVNKDTPQSVIDIVIAAGGVNNLSATDGQQIAAILFTAETAVWCEIDLAAQTVTPIEGVPNSGVFSGGDTFEDNGDVYLPVFTSTGNAYYKWTPISGAVSKAFEITGVVTPDFYNIAKNK